MTRLQWVAVALIVVSSGAAGFYFSSVRNQVPQETATLPSVTMPDLTGAERNLDEWRGQPLLVNFWATWCPPCLKEIPLLVALQDEFRGDGLSIVAIAVDEPGAVRDFVAERSINFPVLLGEETGMGTAAALGADVFALPITALVDRSGRVVYVRTGELTETMARAAIADALAVP